MKTVRVYGCILAFASCLLPLEGQSNFATLSGIVQDAQKQAIDRAQVRVEAVATGAARLTVSNLNGLFEVPGLVPGDYKLTVSAPGFSPEIRNVRLEVAQQMHLELVLQVGAHSESVDVIAGVESLKTRDTSLGDVIEPKSISELPLNGRMLIDLALTVPGAHASHGAQTGDMNPLYWRPGQRSAISVGGARPNANYYLLDGTTNTDPTFNTMNLSPSPDAVQEFQVQTGSYSAEMGGAGGGQINIVTRSGSSQFHGTAYEFLRNNGLDARTFNEMQGASHLVQNNFGASLGGPLRGRKTFFFANYEGLRTSEAVTMIDTVPTAKEAAGNFSESGTHIFDPLGAASGTVRSPFPGDVIPADRISPVAATMLRQYVPRPNLTGGMAAMIMMGQPAVVGAGADSNNFRDVQNQTHTNNQGTVRVDRVFGRGDTLSGRYSISNERGFTPQNLPGFGAFHDNRAQQLSATWSRVISAQALNTASFAMSRLSMNRASQNNASNDIVSQLGVQGVGFGGPGAYGAPWFAVQGYSGFGDSFAATPMQAWDTIFEGRDALSWQRGRHSLKIGGGYRRYIWPMWGFFQNRGFYQFTNGFTTRTAANDGTGSALASFLLGLPAVRQRQAGIPSMDLRQFYVDGYVQDTWRVTPDTTIEAGLRYEYMSPLHDIARPWSNLLVTPNGLQAFIGGQAGYPRGLMFANTHDFAPRVGIARHFSDAGIVLRAAYGIFYTPVDMNTWCNQLHNVPLVFPETNQSNNFIPSIPGFNFAPPVLGKTVVSFAGFDPHAPAQYIQQWSASAEKSLGGKTTLELGYQGSRGFHLQRAHLVNNALPGPGLVQPRRPFQKATFVAGDTIPADIVVASTTFPVSSVNVLENSARSWYDAGYVNVRRRYSNGLTFLANYTWSKNLTDAPDFRSPMFESSVAQNNNDLRAEKGPGCDIRHRFALSAAWDIPSPFSAGAPRRATANWRVSTLYQAQTGFPLTISVFGDTANAGTILGENPVRADYTGLPVFGPGTRTPDRWFNPAAFTAPAAYTFGNAGRNTVYGPGLQTLDFALEREFAITESGRFQIRGEFFNAMNHVNLGTPNRFVNTPQFGTITDAATPGREVQVSARLSF